MLEPTAEALAWAKRADEECARGIICGLRVICRRCLRPVGTGWGGTVLSPIIPGCGCEPENIGSVNIRAAHGLEGVARGLQRGTRTYG